MYIEIVTDENWQDLNKTAVFNCNGVSVDVPEQSWAGNFVKIPDAVLSHQNHGRELTIGVYGANASRVLPSRIASLGVIHTGALD